MEVSSPLQSPMSRSRLHPCPSAASLWVYLTLGGQCNFIVDVASNSAVQLPVRPLDDVGGARGTLQL